MEGRGGAPNLVLRTLFGIAAVIATVVDLHWWPMSTDPVMVVVLLSTTLFFLRWCGMYWCIPSILGGRDARGFLGGTHEPRRQHRRHLACRSWSA